MIETQIREDEIRPDELCPGHLEALARDIERLKAQRAQFVTVACPACGESSGTVRLEKYTFQYVRCAHCETLYMNPRPSPELMASHYADSANYRYWVTHLFPVSEAKRRENIHQPRLKRIITSCDDFGIPRKVLLEVGAGFGTFAALAKETGAFDRVVAVEPTPEMAQACRNQTVQVIEKSLEDISDEIDQVDVAVAFEVIEHVFSPSRFLDQMARLLRPGGLLILTCPNGLGFDIMLLGSESYAVDPGHLNLFNPQSLRLLAQARGFDVQEVDTPGQLDAELVHKAIEQKKFDVSRDLFLRRVLVDEWDRLGGPFQKFLADNGLSSHMWLAARKR